MSETTVDKAPSGRTGRNAARLASALWLWVIPALLAGIVVRYLFPDASDVFDPSSTEPLARFAEDNTATLWALVFLVLAVVARHWSSLVLGGTRRSTEAKREPLGSRYVLSFALAVGAAGASALVFRTSFFQSNRVQGSSMLPGLMPDAYLAVNQRAYGLKLPGLERRPGPLPRRGDVIVLRNPEGPESEELVKRVVGLPGDRIGIAGGRPVINGWVPPACMAGRYPAVGADGPWVARLLLEFLEDRSYLVLLPESGQAAGTLPPIQLGPKEVFVLGDNRPASVDSRAWNKGRGRGVPLASISGRVERILLAADRNGRVDLSRLLKPLSLDLNLSGMDASKLESNVRVCMTLRPKDTNPPPPGKEKAASAPR